MLLFMYILIKNFNYLQKLKFMMFQELFIEFQTFWCIFFSNDFFYIYEKNHILLILKIIFFLNIVYYYFYQKLIHI